MKTRSSPTSPKHQHDIDELYRVEPTIQRPVERSPGLAILILILSVLGSLAAFVGLREFADRHPFYRIVQPFRSSPGTTERVILQQQSNEKVVSVAEIVRSVEPALATIVTDRGGALPQSSDRQGYGTFISSDGTAIVAGVQTLPKQSIARTSSGQNLSITDEQIDPFTGMLVVRANAHTTAIPFANDQTIAVGMPVFIVRYNVVSGGTAVIASSVASLHARDLGAQNNSLIESSEKLSRFMVLSSVIDSSWTGAAVVNEKGELVGVVSPVNDNANTRVVPVTFIKQIASRYQPGNPITRPYLGVRYLDLAYAAAGADQPAKGARIDSDDSKKVPAVAAKSPASIAGLRQDDVIVGIDDTPLNDSASLGEVLNSYDDTAAIELTVIRKGKEQRIRVTLVSTGSPRT